MENIKFYYCPICGNLIQIIDSSGRKVSCCGKEMVACELNQNEMVSEKHLPKVKLCGKEVKVKISDIPHPMEDLHYIRWVYLETEKGNQFKYLMPHDKPEVTFTLKDDRPKRVYASCNIHGLWVNDLVECKDD